jgi:hypothetical protein
MRGIADVAACHAGKRVYLDTKLFIYVLNGVLGLAEHCVSLLDACCRNEVHGVTGDLTAHRPRPEDARCLAPGHRAGVRSSLLRLERPRLAQGRRNRDLGLGGLSFIRLAPARLRPGICLLEAEPAGLNREARG